MARRRETTKEKLASLLEEEFPDLNFDPKEIRRCFDSVKSGGTCRWIAEGREYTSPLRYKSMFLYGQDTMTECVKSGITITDNVCGCREKMMNKKKGCF